MIEIIGYVLLGFVLGIIFDSWLSEQLINLMDDEQFNDWSKKRRK